MKKIFLFLCIFCLLSGCELGNVPTSRVEDYLTRYQMLDKDIYISYTSLTNDTNLSNNLINSYEEAIKKQYRNLSYEVKDEKIDGDTAIVTVQIEVINYKKAIDKYNKNENDVNRYHELVIDAISNTKEMVTYTVDFELTKGSDSKWKVNELSLENKEKMLGIN